MESCESERDSRDYRRVTAHAAILATLRGHTEVVEVLTEHGWNEIAAGQKLFGFDLPLYAARKDHLRQDAAEDDAG